MFKKYFYLALLSVIFLARYGFAEKVVVIPMSSNSSSGSSIAWKGVWENSVVYNEQDMVQYNGSSYIAVADHVATLSNQPPSDSWDLIAAAGLKGDKGDPGSAVTTFAVCINRTSYGTGYCNCGNATLLSSMISSPCSVTSDIGECSASTEYGSCCVCKP